MNLARTLRAFTALVFLSLGFALPSHAAVSAYFSAGSTCIPMNNTVSYVPGGSPVTVSLCMDSGTAATCGYTAVLEAANSGENGRFTVTAVSRTGSPFLELNSEVAQLPLSIVTGPVTVADLGATVFADAQGKISPAAAAPNISLATFSISPGTNATNANYVISLNSVSAAAVDADTKCGLDTIPTDAPLTASFTMSRSNAPAFTSANATTFSSATTNTFTVTAVGSPAPTLSLTGSLPSGVSFNAGTGVLSSTAGVAGGTYNFTFNATNGGPTVTQPFTLTVSAKASQTITFTNPGTQVFSASTIPLVATASSGLPVTFTVVAANPAVCSVFGSTLTMLRTGTCTINADQAGDSNFSIAPTNQQAFGITAAAPGAPTIGTAVAGNGLATISFSAPASTGGSAIQSYTMTCTPSGGGAPVSASGAISPITVNGLTNLTQYNCAVAATNSLGTTGPQSSSVSVTPDAAAPLTLTRVVSRKLHGATPYELTIDNTQLITGSVTSEPRNIGSGHQIVFQFNGPVTSVGGATSVDAAAAPVGTVAAPTFSGNEVVVTLTVVPNGKRAMVTVTGVNGGVPNFQAPVAFLVGDVDGTRNVNVLDIIGVKTRSGQTLSQSNFTRDINLDGSINVLDIIAVKVKSGTSAP